MKTLSSVLFLAFSLIGASPAHAQESGFLNRSVVVSGAEYRYQVYVPRERTAAEALPVILALHGGGQFGRDGISQTAIGLAHAVRRNPERFPAVVVFPQIPPDGTPGFQALGGRIAMAALDRTLNEFAADKSRIYLTGFSAGGNGAWNLASQSPDRFAAALVICGFVGEHIGTTSGLRYPPLVSSGPGDSHRDFAARIAKLPIWIFHGDADPTVNVEQSRQMAAALRSVGANVQYTELPGVLHNAWDPAYARADVIAWLFKQRRE
jgi:predicted peptidase